MHEAMAVIHCAYPNQISDQGKNLMGHRFYHGLLPSLCDALGFAMAELPEREQVNMSFDTLYMLAKKMEVHQPSQPHGGWSGPSDAYRAWHKEHLNSKGASPQKKAPTPINLSQE